MTHQRMSSRPAPDSAPEDFFSRDYFSLFGLPRQFALDAADLADRYRRLQKLAHPDRFAAATKSQQRLALSMAGKLNDAYATLKKPLMRAAYLLSLQQMNVFDETDTVMPVDFLERQIALREQLMDDDVDVAALHDDIRGECDNLVQQVEDNLNRGDYQNAYHGVRQWRYLEKLLEEMQQRQQQR